MECWYKLSNLFVRTKIGKIDSNYLENHYSTKDSMPNTISIIGDLCLTKNAIQTELVRIDSRCCAAAKDKCFLLDKLS